MSDTVATESKNKQPKLQKDLFNFSTVFKGKLGVHRSYVIATDFKEAQEICDKRGFGEIAIEKGEQFDTINPDEGLLSELKYQCHAYMSESGFPCVFNPKYPQTFP